MAFSGGFRDRLEDRRLRHSHASPEEPVFSAFSPPLSSIGSRMQQQQQQQPQTQAQPVTQQHHHHHQQSLPSNSADSRASLPRRFTTTTVPTVPTVSPLSPIGQQRRQAADPSADLSSAVSLQSVWTLKIIHPLPSQPRVNITLTLLQFYQTYHKVQLVSAIQTLTSTPLLHR